MEKKNKPFMDNRCSKGHALFNPTMIRKGRIILADNKHKNEKQSKEKPQSAQTKKFNKFKASIRSSNILHKLQKKDY